MPAQPTSQNPPALPHTKTQVLDRYFLEHRAKLLDLAAFLDRVDRATGDLAEDLRLPALQQAIALLTDNQPRRAKRILDALSDPTTKPLDAAPPTPVLGVAPPSPDPEP